MSAPGAAPVFTIDVVCNSCGKDLHSSTSTSEQEAKENFAKAITASELHDCKESPK